jgi:glycosyltransferase involved in cell wall biosynthesis
VDKMAENLIRIFDNVNYAKELGQQARQIHIEKYSLDRHIKNLENVLYKCLI